MTTTVGPVRTVDSVRAEVESLVPFLSEAAERAERDRQVPGEVLDALTDSGLFLLATPRSRGGLQASMADQVTALQHVARGCPSTSWVATVSLAWTWMVGLFSDQAQGEVFGTPDLRMAGVLATDGEATFDHDGVVLNGRWSWNTGSRSSSWAGLGCTVRADSGPAVPHVALVPYRDLVVIDDWDGTGLMGSSSNTVLADDVYVPGHRLLPMAALETGHYPGSTIARTDPHYRLPALPVITAVSAGTVCGIAHGAVEATLPVLPERAIAYTGYASAAEAPLTHQQVGECRLKVFSMDAHAARVTELIDLADGSLSTLGRVEVRAHLGHAAHLAREIVETLFRASGAAAIRRTAPIQRFHRDIQALTQHGLIQPTTATELLGRTELGLEPNTDHL